MKVRNPYAPLHPSRAIALAAEVCPDWRMVTAVLGRTCGPDVDPVTTPYVSGVAFGNRTHGGPPAWYERRADGSGQWHEGAPPMQCGVVCDAAWRPVEVVTNSGRRLPNLAAPEVAADA